MIDLQELARRGGGTFHGTFVLLPGPGHSGQDRSLSVRIGRHGQLMWHSFAGDSDAAVRAHLKMLGVDVHGARAQSAPEARRATAAVDARAKRNAITAVRLWQESEPLDGTLGARYLENRGIRPPWPGSLRYHPRCLDRDQQRPTLVAACTRLDALDQVNAVYRTFLCPETGCKADIPTPKKALGAHKGGGVVLGEFGDALLVAEGIETALSASAQFCIPAVATLGADFMPNLIIPARVVRVLIAADNDEPGLRAAKALALRLRSQGRDVRIKAPPAGFKDFNDLALWQSGPKSP